MMNVGNQVKIKTCGQEGWIYSILDSDKIIVGVREDNVVSMRIVSKDGKAVFVGESNYDIVFETERSMASVFI